MWAVWLHPEPGESNLLLNSKDNLYFRLKISSPSISQLKLYLVILPNQRRQWHPTPVLLPGKSHGRRSLVGCNPWGHKELGTTGRLTLNYLWKQSPGSPQHCKKLKTERTSTSLLHSCLEHCLVRDQLCSGHPFL